MTKNRLIPYGYQIKNGVLVLHDEEAEIVRQIYIRYANGNSYKAISENLTSTGIKYMPDKAEWNKNMVARILQNRNYLGTEKYPTIITKDLNEKSEKAKKQYTKNLSQELKIIRPLLRCEICGEQISRRNKCGGNGRWFCPTDSTHISSNLTDDELISHLLVLQQTLGNHVLELPKRENITSFEVIKLQNEIDRLLADTVENISAVQRKMLELASLRFKLCEDTLHIEHAIIKQLKTSPKEVKSKLLTQIVEEIRISDTIITGINLRNGLVLKKGVEANE